MSMTGKFRNISIAFDLPACSITCQSKIETVGVEKAERAVILFPAYWIVGRK